MTFAWPDGDDLAVFLGVDEVGDAARAALACELAVGAVLEAAEGQTLVAVSNGAHTVELPVGQYLMRGSIWLPQWPVTAISAVTEGGRALGASEYVATPRLARVQRTPSDVWAGRVVVTYSHGFSTIPAGLKAIVLRVATRLYTNPLGKLQVDRGQGVTESFGRTGPGDMEIPELFESERRQLRAYLPPLLG